VFVMIDRCETHSGAGAGVAARRVVVFGSFYGGKPRVMPGCPETVCPLRAAV
jgi:hypothetical protein